MKKIIVSFFFLFILFSCGQDKTTKIDNKVSITGITIGSGTTNSSGDTINNDTKITKVMDCNNFLNGECLDKIYNTGVIDKGDCNNFVDGKCLDKIYNTGVIDKGDCNNFVDGKCLDQVTEKL